MRMSETPPKHAPENTGFGDNEGGGQLVAMYNAASHATAESFPVLKAFQDYIEAERAAARKRVVQLSVFFAVLMGVVVTGFLTAGIFMLRNMSEVQNKLLDVALAERAATPPQAPAPVLQTSPLIEESVRQISRATSDLQSNMDKRIEGVSEIAAKVHDRVASQDSELQKLRDSLRQMQEQGAMLHKELVTAKEEREKTIAAAVKTAQATVAAPPLPAAVPSVKTAAAVPPPAQTPAPPAPAPVPAKPVASAEKPKTDPRFPPAVKDPPSMPDGITPPDAPPGMIATSIPLKTKRSGTIPWRVLMPE